MRYLLPPAAGRQAGGVKLGFSKTKIYIWVEQWHQKKLFFEVPLINNIT